jgi:hypothetical protein
VIDALLYSMRDGIRAAGMGYGRAECEIQDDGKPPPRCGNFFAAVHGGRKRPGPANDNNLDELYGFSVTLTMRVTVPQDRVGDQQVARNVPLTLDGVPLAQRQGFDAREEQLRGFLHMNWALTVLQGQVFRGISSANDNLAAWATGTVYGFCEPARYQGPELPRLVGGEWFAAEPDAEDVGIVSELRFDGARRFQQQLAAVGPFV